MHTIQNKAKLLARVRRIEGQVGALARLLDAERDCGEVLQQIAAIRGAVTGLMSAVIEGHLTQHIVDQPDLDRRRDDLGVMLQVLKSYLK